MAQQTGVKINKLQGGLGRRNDSTDSYFALVASMVLVGLTGVFVNKAVKLIQIEDAEALGINASFDANNKTLVYHHISEFFRIAPNGTLFLIPVADNAEITATIPDILPVIRENKEIKGLGFVGFSNNLDAIPAQVEIIEANIVTELNSENRFIDFILVEGKKGASVINVANLASLREKNAPHISVIISQDPAIAALDAEYSNYASVGSALGGLAVRKISENLGSVNIINKPDDKKGTQDYPLSDTVLGRFLSANLSDGKNVESLSKTNLKALTDKGYIYAAGYEGYGGMFFNNSCTSVSKSSDFANIENNRIWNAAARIIRATLIPEVKGKVKKDPTTGYIKTTTVSRWVELVKTALDNMIIDDDISGFDFYIDYKQVVNDDSPVKGKCKIVADGIVHEFEIDLGLTKNI